MATNELITGLQSYASGFIDDVNGYNFAGGCTAYSNVTGACTQCGGTPVPWSDSSVDPEYYHGTHVAGLAGGMQDNGIGITGLANGVKLMILRVCLQQKHGVA
jgi:subtilisin family serine protease